MARKPVAPGSAPAAAAPAPQRSPSSPAASAASTAGGGDEDLAQTYAYLIAALDQGKDQGEISADSHGLVRENLKRRLALLVPDEPVSRSR